MSAFYPKIMVLGKRQQETWETRIRVRGVFDATSSAAFPTESRIIPIKQRGVQSGQRYHEIPSDHFRERSMIVPAPSSPPGSARVSNSRRSGRSATIPIRPGGGIPDTFAPVLFRMPGSERTGGAQALRT